LEAGPETPNTRNRLPPDYDVTLSNSLKNDGLLQRQREEPVMRVGPITAILMSLSALGVIAVAVLGESFMALRVFAGATLEHFPIGATQKGIPETAGI
jgi:hypothetical protein